MIKSDESREKDDHGRLVLPKVFVDKGFRFEVVQRTNDLAILEKTKGAWKGYEVVFIQKHDGVEICGKYSEPREYLPSASQWGDQGFSYCDLLSAQNKFKTWEIELRASGKL